MNMQLAAFVSRVSLCAFASCKIPEDHELLSTQTHGVSFVCEMCAVDKLAQLASVAACINAV